VPPTSSQPREASRKPLAPRSLPSPVVRAPDWLRSPTVLAALALAASFVTVVAIALSDLSPNRTIYEWASHSPRPVRRATGSLHRQAATPAAARAQPQAPQAMPPATLTATPAHVSPAVAAQLEAQGHQLLAQGSYASAIPPLASAVRTSGQSLGDCLQPASEACLTFAYALYDLGRALRLEGHDAEAVSVLSERLRIDNQRETVQRELELARAGRA
jgi:hypothetical protein